jgi:chromosome segregation ATPase
MLAMLRTRVESLDALRGGVTEEVLDERLAASTAGITALAERVESLDALRAGVTEEVLEERLAAATEGIAALGERVDALAASVATATAGLAEKERELAALQETFLDSGTRIETIVVDLRDALRALEEADPDAIRSLTARVEAALGEVASVAERVERLESAPARDDGVEKLAEKLEAVDRRLESVAGEIARAKTLWPVALRSLEARLDDAVTHKAAAALVVDAEPGTEQSQPAADGEDDLLAELRDSLQVMESVAAEIERAADGLSEPDAAEDMDDDEQQAVAGGARVVPLRASEP